MFLHFALPHPHLLGQVDENLALLENLLILK
jgi:hypothetical protein